MIASIISSTGCVHPAFDWSCCASFGLNLACNGKAQDYESLVVNIQGRSRGPCERFLL